MDFELLPHQHQFIFSDKKFVNLDGGYGNGKSTAWMIKTALHCMNNPGTLMGVFMKDYARIRDAALTDWKEMFGGFGNYNKTTHFFEWEQNDSKILFGGLKELDKIKNHNFSAFVIEQAESVTQEAFSYLIGRLRRDDVDNSDIDIKTPGGVKRSYSMADRWGAVVSNPEGHDWIWKIFNKKDLSDLAVSKKIEDSGPQISEDDFHYIWADTFSNIDNLSEDYLAGLQALPDHLYERYVEGSRDSFEGQIYPMLDKQYHVVEPFQIPKEWNKYLLLDHGVRNPTAVNWVALDFDGNIFVYREHYKKQGDGGKEWVISEHAEKIKEYNQDTENYITPYEEHFQGKFADPAIFQRSLQRDDRHYSVAEEYEDHGLNFQAWKKAANNEDKLAQINRVAEHLMLNDERTHPTLNESPSPQIFFLATCENTWEEHTQYRWSQKARRMTDEENEKEKPRNYMDHTCDNICGFLSMKRTAPEIKKSAPKGSFKELQEQLKNRQNNTSKVFDTPTVK